MIAQVNTIYAVENKLKYIAMHHLRGTVTVISGTEVANTWLLNEILVSLGSRMKSVCLVLSQMKTFLHSYAAFMMIVESEGATTWDNGCCTGLSPVRLLDGCKCQRVT